MGCKSCEQRKLMAEKQMKAAVRCPRCGSDGMVGVTTCKARCIRCGFETGGCAD